MRGRAARGSVAWRHSTHLVLICRHAFRLRPPAFRRVFQAVDAVLTPATGVTAPAIRPDVLPDGESDLTTLLAIVRFAAVANLTGLPAIAFPAGYEKGLPVGIQAIGSPSSEHLLLRLARAAEPLVPRRRPDVFYRLLGD
jgi:Asp-tRNA(Asn)/Glu-tRNA(Gln) amidotransferase A subunit family amidase